MLPVRIVDTIIFLTLFICLTAAYPPRKKKKACYVSIPFFTAISMGMILLEERLPGGNTPIYLLLFVVMGSIFGAAFLSGQFPERLVFLVMFTSTFELFNGITLYLNDCIQANNEYLWRLMNVPLMILGGYASYRFALKSRNGLPWFCWLPIILTALLTMAQHMVRPTFVVNLTNADWLQYRAICSVFRLVILYLAFFSCSRMIRYYETSLQLAVQEKMADSQKRMVDESLRLNRELSRQRHEYNHMLTAAAALLQRGEYAQLAELLQPHTEDMTLSENSIHSGNPAADAILNQKAAEAKRLRIPFEVDACLTPDLPLSATELVTLLANLIDNALEASKNVDDPSIRIHIYPTPCYLCFSVRNRADCAQLDGENLQTTKPNKEYHGFGLNLIRDIAQAHQGVALFTPTRDGIFVAEVSVFLGSMNA